MKLLLTLQEYNDKKPVYPLQIPEYLENVLNISLEQYFESAMLATQRLINSYSQNYFLKRNYDIDSLSSYLVAQIKDILFMQFQYLHENQLFFEKTADINYSTAGQQTFTFVPDLQEGENFPLIPKTIKRMIINAGLITYSTNIKDDQFPTTEFENRFLDGYFVPEVKWDDKANNVDSINGTNWSVWSYLNFVEGNAVWKDNTDFLNAVKIANFFIDPGGSKLILENKLLTSNTFYEVKEEKDYAQIKDVLDVWTDANSAIVQNTQNINDLIAATEQLENNKLDINDAELLLQQKANVDLKNVNVGEQTTQKFLKARTDGTLVLTSEATNIAYEKWDFEKTYLQNEMVWYEINNKAVFYVSRKNDNLNYNPASSIEWWAEYENSVDLAGYISELDTFNNFLNLDGLNSMRANLNLNGFNVENSGNLLEKNKLNDSLISSSNLWSSQKIKNEIDKNKPDTAKIKKYEAGQIVLADSENDFLLISNKYNKVRGEDWINISSDYNLISGDNGLFVGQNYITNSNIELISAAHSHTTPFYPAKQDASGSAPLYGKYSGGSSSWSTTSASVLIGSSNPVKFTPRSKEVFVVKILKDWIIDAAMIEEISSGGEWGSIIGDIENQTDLWSNLSNLRTDIDVNESAINLINTTSIPQLNSLIDQNTTDVSQLKTEVVTLESDKANKNEVVKLTNSSEQTINSDVRILGAFNVAESGEAIKMQPRATNQSCYFGFYNSDSDRIGYLGKSTSGNEKITLASEDDDLVLASATSNIDFANNSIKNIDSIKRENSGYIKKLGFGTTNWFFYTEPDTPINGSERFEIGMNDTNVYVNQGVYNGTTWTNSAYQADTENSIITKSYLEKQLPDTAPFEVMGEVSWSTNSDTFSINLNSSWETKKQIKISFILPTTFNAHLNIETEATFYQLRNDIYTNKSLPFTIGKITFDAHFYNATAATFISTSTSTGAETNITSGTIRVYGR